LHEKKTYQCNVIRLTWIAKQNPYADALSHTLEAHVHSFSHLCRARCANLFMQNMLQTTTNKINNCQLDFCLSDVFSISYLKNISQLFQGQNGEKFSKM
jgi:hypothetical protein